MAKKAIPIETLMHLCKIENDIYISKEGAEYIEALNELFELANKNDKPFTKEDILESPLKEEFEFPGVDEFKLICYLKAQPMTINNGRKRNERINALDFIGTEELEIFSKSLGITYLITCETEGQEHIIKIGSTRTTFEKRLQSYNCGTVSNWRTASTTNIKILQSMLTTRETFKLYVIDCSDEIETYKWHGVESVPFASAKALAYEDILVKEYLKQFKKKPLANVQANATEVEGD